MNIQTFQQVVLKSGLNILLTMVLLHHLRTHHLIGLSEWINKAGLATLELRSLDAFETFK